VNRANVVALTVLLFAARLLMAQASVSENNMDTKSDREREGLRGPVKSYTIERTSPSTTDAQGNMRPEMHWATTTEFDLQGHSVLTRNDNSDGHPWISRKTFDASGRLLNEESGVEGQPPSETNYSYDSQGRLQSITTGNGSPVSFQYDAHGRKTKIQSSQPDDYRGSKATGAAISPFDAADSAPNLPGGGTATTIYDEQDRPTEIQFRNTSGEVVSRVVRKYDAKGHVIDEQQIWERPESMFPSNVLQQIIEQSGRSADDLRQEMREQLSKLMGGNMGPQAMSYRYDDHGRVLHTARRIFNTQSEIDTSYNDHGDIESEITRAATPADNSEAPAIPLPPYYEVGYRYRYDQQANWIEQTSSFRNSPNEAFKMTSTTKRTLTYY
jgi:YD repeat-containing protein